MRQLSLADRGQTVSLDRAPDDAAPTCLGVARLGSLQTAGTSFTVWMQVRGSSWVEAKEGRFRLRQGEWIAFEKESRPLVQAGRNGLCIGLNLNVEALRELAEMAKLGMSDAQVLRSSTTVAADLLGVSSELGTVEVGKIADLVVWEGESLDVSDMRSRVSTVIQGGVVAT